MAVKEPVHIFFVTFHLVFFFSIEMSLCIVLFALGTWGKYLW